MIADSRTAAFRLLPLTFHGLVVESTNRCNAKCAMCYQSSGPRGSDDWGPFRLSLPAIKSAMQQARLIPSLQPRFHLAGGEAFIHAKDCFDLFDHARSSGYSSVTTTSNCFWGSSPKRAKEFAAKLKKSGLTNIEISWDVWHQPYIEPSCIDNAILACARQGVFVNLRILTTRAHGPREALSALSEESLAAVDEISSGPVFPTGRAERTISPEEFHYAAGPTGACHSVLNLTINSKGGVYPCCAGADQTDSLAYGNIMHEALDSIYRRMNSDPMLRVLVFYGVGALVPVLEEQDHIRQKAYANICHLCWDIFSKPDRVAQIKRHFKAIENEQAKRALALIGN